MKLDFIFGFEVDIQRQIDNVDDFLKKTILELNSLTKLSSSLRVYVRIDTCRIGVRVNETDVRFVIGDTIGDIQYSRGCIVRRTDTEYFRQVSTYDRLSISYHESDQLHRGKILEKVRGNDVHSSDRRKVFR